MPRDRRPDGRHASATSVASTFVALPRQVMRRARTVSASVPAAPSTSSAPPLLAVSSATRRSTPAGVTISTAIATTAIISTANNAEITCAATRGQRRRARRVAGAIEGAGASAIVRS